MEQNQPLVAFNKPHLTGKEVHYIYQAVQAGKISGDGYFTKLCQGWFERRYSFPKCLLTTSCTDALEMAALLLNIAPGDEVIVPSFTFVSAANAFVLRGASIVFADSCSENPNIDVSSLERLITDKTRAIILVHYAGVACDMDAICEIARAHNIDIVEDVAHGVDSFHRDRPLGSFGRLAAFSFHETKNISSGEGGLIVINDPSLFARAEIIREKGTNRSQYFRGEVDKYSWVDVGSSFLPSDLIAAFLYAQIENIDDIQNRRRHIWARYHAGLSASVRPDWFKLPAIPSYASNNAHMYYIVCQDLEERTDLISRLGTAGIHAVFHYVPLHSSPYYHGRHGDRELPNADRYSDTVLRLPMHYDLTDDEIDRVVSAIVEFYQSRGGRD